jgi:hypothetical protein
MIFYINTDGSGSVYVEEDARGMRADEDCEIGPLAYLRLKICVGSGASTPVICENKSK